MRQNRFLRPSPQAFFSAPLALALLATACSHPSANPTGSGTGNGGSTGSGNSTGSGSGGSSSTGSGGNGGDIVILPDGGAGGGGGAPTKAACLSDPNQRQALAYAPGYSISASATSQANSIVQSMSVDEKLQQIRGMPKGNGFNVFESENNTAKSVKGFQFSDGPRGVNLDATKPTGGQGYSTVFPVAAARGASFDVDLENQIGAAMGDELVAAGRTMLLAPTVNILRHPAWGRSQETYGEDSFLLGRLGSAFTVGVQTYAPACAKHYAANNIERARAVDVAQMDEQTLHEVYARHFGMIIRDAGAACIMAAYNLVQSPPTGTQLNCTQNKHLLTDILRTEFGFQGFVLSDWWAMPGGNAITSVDVMKPQATQALLSGLDMELPWNLQYDTLGSSLGAAIQESDITKAALRVLTQKYRFNVASLNASIGLKTPTTGINGSYSITNNQSHIDLALKAAIEGTVLLKNGGSTLPIKSGRVAVVSQQVPWSLFRGQTQGSVNFATDARVGDLGSSRVNVDPAKAVGPFAGIQATAPSGITVLPGHDLAAAQSADVVVVVAGLTPEDEGEEYTIDPEDTDRDASLSLDGKRGGTLQNMFISQVAALNKPMVVVLEGGSAIDIPQAWRDNPRMSIVMAWYPGQAGGTALGQLLFGQANFSGKLPITWPSSLADEPRFSGGVAGNANATAMSYYVGYRWFDNQGKTPLYPFGHGLSYTTFEYSNLLVPCTTVEGAGTVPVSGSLGGVVNVSVDVKNTGSVDGDEIVFLFVSWPNSTVPNRRGTYKELKGFRRVSLKAGQAARVPIRLRVSDLSYYDTASSSWKIEPGAVNVLVGPSSDKLTLTDSFTVVAAP